MGNYKPKNPYDSLDSLSECVNTGGTCGNMLDVNVCNLQPVNINLNSITGPQGEKGDPGFNIYPTRAFMYSEDITVNQSFRSALYVYKNTNYLAIISNHTTAGGIRIFNLDINEQIVSISLNLVEDIVYNEFNQRLYVTVGTTIYSYDALGGDEITIIDMSDITPIEACVESITRLHIKSGIAYGQLVFTGNHRDISDTPNFIEQYAFRLDCSQDGYCDNLKMRLYYRKRLSFAIDTALEDNGTLYMVGWSNGNNVLHNLMMDDDLETNTINVVILENINSHSVTFNNEYVFVNNTYGIERVKKDDWSNPEITTYPLNLYGKVGGINNYNSSYFVESINKLVIVRYPNIKNSRYSYIHFIDPENLFDQKIYIVYNGLGGYLCGIDERDDTQIIISSMDSHSIKFLKYES